MVNSFNIEDYLRDLGQELIRAYAAAGMATTPSAVGSARESAVRERLEQVLPPGIGVGTGFVIDSFGGISRQIDIVLYEKELSPVYSLNDEIDYFPCEGVFSVGEVKSRISGDDIEDIFTKIGSVRALRRYAVDQENLMLGGTTVCYRNYGSTTAFVGTSEESYDQDAKTSDRIHGFGIGSDFGISSRASLHRFVEHSSSVGDENTPDILLTVNGPTILPWSVADGRPGSGKHVVDADGFAMINLDQYALIKLLQYLSRVFSTSRTVKTDAYNQYLKPSSNPRFNIVDYQGKMVDFESSPDV